MLRTRVAAVVFGTALAVGGSAAVAVQGAGASPSGSSETETTLPATGGPVTLTIAGVGTVTFNVDATGAISNLVVTPIDGVTLGTPVVTDEGVQVQVTGPGGAMQVLEISAKHDDGGIEVETEVDLRDHEDANHPANEDNHDGQGDNHGPEAEHHDETAPTPGPAGTAPGGDQSGGDHSGDGSSGGGDSSGGHGGDSGGE